VSLAPSLRVPLFGTPSLPPGLLNRNKDIGSHLRHGPGGDRLNKAAAGAHVEG